MPAGEVGHVPEESGLAAPLDPEVNVVVVIDGEKVVCEGIAEFEEALDRAFERVWTRISVVIDHASR